MKDVIITRVIELIFTVLSAVITIVLLPAITTWLKSKTQNAKIQAVITDISAAVATCVDHAEQTMVTALKEKNEWTSETQTDVLDTVVNNVVDILLESTKQTIADNGIDLENMIAQRVEAYIQSKKAISEVGEKK